MQTDATLLRLFAHPVACCCAKFETGKTFELATPNISFVTLSPKRSPTHVGSVCKALPTLLEPLTRQDGCRIQVYKALWVLSFPQCDDYCSLCKAVGLWRRAKIRKASERARERASGKQREGWRGEPVSIFLNTLIRPLPRPPRVNMSNVTMCKEEFARVRRLNFFLFYFFILPAFLDTGLLRGIRQERDS